MKCDVIGCERISIYTDEDGQELCERHMPDLSVRPWSEMKAEGIEIETMEEYRNEVRGLNDDYEGWQDAYDDTYDNDYLYGED